MNLTDHIAKTVISKQCIPDVIPYTAISFRDREGYLAAFFNKPEFVLPGPQYTIKTLPIQKALPAPAGERVLENIRYALEGEIRSDVITIPQKDLIHEMHAKFFPWTEDLVMILLRNPLHDEKRLSNQSQVIHKLHELYQSRTLLAPTDPTIVLWIDHNFVVCDQRHQPGILLRNPETQFKVATTVREELPEKEAMIVECNVLKAITSGEPQHFRLNVMKGQCCVTEDCICYPLTDKMVMNTITYIRVVNTEKMRDPELFPMDPSYIALL